MQEPVQQCIEPSELCPAWEHIKGIRGIDESESFGTPFGQFYPGVATVTIIADQILRFPQKLENKLVNLFEGARDVAKVGEATRRSAALFHQALSSYLPNKSKLPFAFASAFVFHYQLLIMLHIGECLHLRLTNGSKTRS